MSKTKDGWPVEELIWEVKLRCLAAIPALLVVAFVFGCGGAPVAQVRAPAVAEVVAADDLKEPAPYDGPRFTEVRVKDGWNIDIYVLTDHKTGQEYIYLFGTGDLGVAIAPLAKAPEGGPDR